MTANQCSQKEVSPSFGVPNGENIVTDDPADVIKRIETDLDEALCELNCAKRTIEQTQRKLAIPRERDDMPGNV